MATSALSQRWRMVPSAFSQKKQGTTIASLKGGGGGWPPLSLLKKGRRAATSALSQKKGRGRVTTSALSQKEEGTTAAFHKGGGGGWSFLSFLREGLFLSGFKLLNSFSNSLNCLFQYDKEEERGNLVSLKEGSEWPLASLFDKRRTGGHFCPFSKEGGNHHGFS